ncbi:MAG: bacteriohemerythrin [Chromatiales bacterium]|jgi:hemerythrin|nr:MAG: bacteriohemerythrin [Chromatiales bacterium]
MSRIEWRPEFATGIADVDHEHRELIEWLNRALAASVEPGVQSVDLAELLGEIFARISAHFALEERIMKVRQYDEFASHKQDHERLLDDIRDIMDTVESGTAFVPDQFVGRLTEWFSGHFRTHDARFHRVMG